MFFLLEIVGEFGWWWFRIFFFFSIAIFEISLLDTIKVVKFYELNVNCLSILLVVVFFIFTIIFTIE